MHKIKVYFISLAKRTKLLLWMYVLGMYVFPFPEESCKISNFQAFQAAAE